MLQIVPVFSPGAALFWPKAAYRSTVFFICGLFNNVVNVLDCIASNDKMINE
jgi:hypothetical protein